MDTSVTNERNEPNLGSCSGDLHEQIGGRKHVDEERGYGPLGMRSRARGRFRILSPPSHPGECAGPAKSPSQPPCCLVLCTRTDLPPLYVLRADGRETPLKGKSRATPASENGLCSLFCAYGRFRCKVQCQGLQGLSLPSPLSVCVLCVCPDSYRRAEGCSFAKASRAQIRHVCCWEPSLT